MARQSNFLSSGQVIATSLHTEVQRSYLEYAMSVIVGRALPDVRDGLKPVHRRILYAMHELGLTPDRPYRKCARVVGDVLGKYHPHGDQSVYDALVRMVQDFSSRYPLLAGHGNFGSVDNDPPAAMRYTETRLASVSHEAMLSEIREATVDFIGNFDNSQQEPLVLPAQLPFLLLNGASGIAVGMATNIPPHNLGEIVDGLIALIDRPNLSDDDLIAIIPGPDFPTGGEIVGTEGIQDAYRTGRGSIPVRGVAKIEEISGGRGRQRRTAIVITELPYQVNKAAWIEKVASLVNQNRLHGIADIRDESDREGMRVVIELKRDCQPQALLASLYKQTALQSNFGSIMLALAESQPLQMSLREMLQQFLTFRETTLTRQYSYELEQVERRIHVLDGLLLALNYLDDLIDILRNAPDGPTAQATLQTQFDLSERQASSILSMPLRRLTGMEQQGLQTEFDELMQKRQTLQRLLNNRHELMKSLKKDLRALKRKFGDERRTRILTDAERKKESERLAKLEAAEASVSEEVVLEFTQRGYIRRLSPKSFERQHQRQLEQASAQLTEQEEVTLQIEPTNTQQTVLTLTDTGKAYTIDVKEIPATNRNSKGTPLITLLPSTVRENKEAIASQLILPSATDETDPTPDLLILTQLGKIKRLPLDEFSNVSNRGLQTLKLKDGDRPQQMTLVQAGQELVLATSGGRLLRFEVNDEQLPYQSRNSQGQTALRLSKKETLIGCAVINPGEDVMLMTSQGYAKRLNMRKLRLANRGDLGVQAMKFTTKTDQLVGILCAQDDAQFTVLTTQSRVAYVPIRDIPYGAKTHPGDRPFKVTRGEKMETIWIALSPSPSDDDSGDDEEE